jgi:hypothetical protein
MLLLLSGVGAIIFFFYLPVAVFIGSAVLLLVFVMWPLDALTVRLVPAGKWRGWLLGYEI